MQCVLTFVFTRGKSCCYKEELYIVRLQNYYEDIKAKIAETIALSKELGCDKVIHGGDLTDAPAMSLAMCDEIVDLIEDGQIPWDVIRGNHDEIGHNPNLSGESILDHIFRRSKIIRHLGGQANSKDDNMDVFIEGFDYYHGIEKDIKEKGLNCCMPHLPGKKIAVVHAFITPVPFLPSVLHIQIPDIKTDFDLVLIAHNHSEFGIIKQGRTTYVSIGALARKTIASGDTSRMPNVLFIDTEAPIIRVIPLKCGKPAEEVFDMVKVREAKEFTASIDNFIQSLESTKFQGLNLRAIIEQLAQQEGIDREVVDEIMERIGSFE